MKEATSEIDWLKEQVEAYEAILDDYEDLCEIMRIILKEAKGELGISGIIEARAKNLPSFVGKIVRKQEKYHDPVNQFTDLCGVRIITEYKDDIEPLCDFIRKHFDVDEANSEDVIERLGVSQFGYRSVHFIVSLRPCEFDELLSASGKNPKKFYTQRTEKICQEHRLPPGPRYKIEIQVRTMLQHTWSLFNHDRIYKSDFDIPPHLQREANRIAATLEEIDEAIARTVEGVRQYRTYFGPYRTVEQRNKEIEKLKIIFSYDPDNAELAHKIARLAISLDDWKYASQCLEPFMKKWKTSSRGEKLLKCLDIIREEKEREKIETAESEIERLRDPRMSQIVLDYGRSQWKLNEKSNARNYIEWAISLDPHNIHARVALADTFSSNRHEALEKYEEAFRTEPSEPEALRKFIHCKMNIDNDTKIISLIRPSIEAAIRLCNERARAGVYIPEAYYDIGFFNLLLGRPYESLSAFARALIDTESETILTENMHCIESLNHRSFIKDLPDIKSADSFFKLAFTIKHLQWAEKAGEEVQKNLKIIEEAEKELREKTGAAHPSKNDKSIAELIEKKKKAEEDRKQASKSEKENRKKAEDAGEELKKLRTKEFPKEIPKFPPQQPIIIVAGGTDTRFEKDIAKYKCLLELAFDGFNGTIFSGGTKAGICGIIGDLSGTFLRIAGLPENLPQIWPKEYFHSGYKRYKTPGEYFSAMDPIQTWIDLIAYGVKPGQVKLLGVNGGKISSFEFRLALAMGAKVGLFQASGRAASAIFKDPDWKNVPGLLMLPNDHGIVKIFVQGIQHAEVLKEKDREILAKRTHEEYRKEQKKSHMQNDPALAEWDDLHLDLKNSNLDQIDHIEQKLHIMGMKVEKVESGAIDTLDFSDEPFNKDIEKVAEMEHARWTVERLLAGWTLGEKDVAKKKSPHLVAWSDLPEKIKKYDRDAVIKIPMMLAEMGYRVIEAARKKETVSR